MEIDEKRNLIEQYIYSRVLEINQKYSKIKDKFTKNEILTSEVDDIKK